MNTILFVLDEKDLEMMDELTLQGVICGKIAKGEYSTDSDIGHLKTTLDSCTKVNTGLHYKLNKVREALNAVHPDLRKEDEL